MRLPRHAMTVGAFAILTGLTAGATIAARDHWLPWLAAASSAKAGADEDAGHAHASDDDHDHAMENSLRLSEQARANLGLKLGTVELSDFTKTLVIPGVIVEQPGHSERRITTSLAGVVMKVHAFPGQAVKPGDPLLDVQPTGELLTNAQANLLKTLQDIELVDIELKRLTPLVESGSIPARTKLEKDYERKRLDAQKLVQIQELLVRGLTPHQITEMVEHKTLLREFTIHVPGGTPKRPPTDEGHDHPSIVPTALAGMPERLEALVDDVVYTVEKIEIFPGKLVQPGDELCDLALHTELYLEGHGFERDSRVIALAVQQQRQLTALFEGDEDAPEQRDGLTIRYVENSLDAATRTLRFFVPLKNEVIRDALADNGVIYRSWRFKPGQKVRLLVPVATLQDQIVLPADAVMRDGPEATVFRANGALMERVPVTIIHRDPRFVVLRNDGSVFPGDELALNQAHQLHLAMKKQQGSGVDLHAGHNH